MEQHDNKLFTVFCKTEVCTVQKKHVFLAHCGDLYLFFLHHLCDEPCAVIIRFVKQMSSLLKSIFLKLLGLAVMLLLFHCCVTLIILYTCMNWTLKLVNFLLDKCLYWFAHETRVNFHHHIGTATPAAPLMAQALVHQLAKIKRARVLNLIHAYARDVHENAHSHHEEKYHYHAIPFQ